MAQADGKIVACLLSLLNIYDAPSPKYWSQIALFLISREEATAKHLDGVRTKSCYANNAQESVLLSFENVLE